ncbi:hypothetical protein [Thaumasiovibrio subtropicus]|uniref:hypothetical protein n=1 Tax=Thaumasiovibrio subtropicus TaxID=1891207 RepID=UPI000B35B104|nr:hypothetical protein [Thaumasiovibrio subtropicus]
MNSKIFIIIPFVVIFILWIASSKLFEADLGLEWKVSGTQYVLSGDWIFNCSNGYIISREILEIPEDISRYNVKEALGLLNRFQRDKEPVNSAIRSLFLSQPWTDGFQYSHSQLLGYKRGVHFDTWVKSLPFEGKTYLLSLVRDTVNNEYVWALRVDADNNHSQFGYDYEVRSAIKSCPLEQPLFFNEPL